MKEDVINVVRILGIGLDEILVEIDLGFYVVHTIEWRQPNDIILHSFKDGLDYEMNFDSLSLTHQKIVHRLLTILVYN